MIDKTRQGILAQIWAKVKWVNGLSGDRVIGLFREKGNGSKLSPFSSFLFPKKTPFTVHYSLKKAFTLSEVLITLGVIGVIAAMVLPPLIIKNQNDTCVAQLKKFDSDFSQALNFMANDYGCSGDLKCTGLFTTGNSDFYLNSVSIMQSLSKYLKTDKICGPEAPDSGNSSCFPYNGYRLLNGINATAANGFYELMSGDRDWATLQNGVFYGILNTGSCSTTMCAFVFVDVNGKQAPNQMGRDVFYFNITPTGSLQPARGQFTSCDSTDNCNTGDTGKSCACKIIQNGWKMDY